MQLKKKHRLYYLFSLIFGICLAILFNFIMAFPHQSINIEFEVSKNIGFNVGTDYLDFGKINSPGKSTKSFLLSGDSTGQNITFGVSKNIKEFVYISDNNFILGPNQDKLIEIEIIIPSGVKFEKYSGKLEVYSN